MAADIPKTEPRTITAGSTATWKITLADWLAGDGWTLKYELRKESAGIISITSSASGNDHLVTVSAATTLEWGAGRYHWYSFVEGGSSERYDIAKGIIDVRPDPATAAAFDGRSHARKMLDAIEAMLEGNASREEQSLSFEDGRQIQFCSREELMKFRGIYRNEVRQEDAADAIANGRGSGNRVLTRFVKPS